MHLKTYLKFWVTGQFRNKKLLTAHYSSIFEIDFKNLSKKNIQLLIFDYDNTLACYHQKSLNQKTIHLLKNLQKQNFRIAILSNSSKSNIKKLEKIFESYNIYISKNQISKPHKQEFLNILKIHKIKPSQTAMIGDRITTDIYGAYLANIKERILVDYFDNSKTCPKAPSIDRIIKQIEKSLIL